MRQTFIATILLATVGATCAGVQRATSDERLVEFRERGRERRCAAQKWDYSNNRCFRDDGDRLLLEELPAADYSQGGVYLIGSSTLAWATRLWELPPEQRALIHNYSFDLSNHEMHRQLMEFLVERQNLLAAGGRRSLVIFGLSYHCVIPEYDPERYFVRLWGRYGLYTCSREEGIAVVPMQPKIRELRIARIRIAARIRSTIEECVERFKEQFFPLQSRVLRPDEFRTRMTAGMGAAWEEKIATQIGELRRLIEYLQAHDVQVEAALLPMGSWDDNLPFRGRYNAAASAVSRDLQVPIHDWSGLLADEEFSDHGHPNVEGARRVHKVFIEQALAHLDKTSGRRHHELHNE